LCRFANAFIPDKNENDVIIPENELGLRVHLGEEGQKNFALKFENQPGIIIHIDDGHCLCAFEDWPSFFRFMEQIRQENKVKVLPVLVFWSSDSYELNDSFILDLTVDKIPEDPKEGRLIYVQVSVSKRLTQSLGDRIVLKYKSGKILSGILEIFEKEGNYGAMRTENERNLIYFNENEIESVILPI